MNFKLAILAAAAVGAATTAQAADLAKKAPAAANYVKVCDAQGAGFFYIPGSETCLKIGGYVRAEYRAFGNNSAWNDGSGRALAPTNGSGRALAPTNGGHRNQHNINTFARGEIDIDARTATEFGLLRSFIALQADVLSGSSTSVALDKGFIQFGGLTAGRAQSMFDFFTGSTIGNMEPAHSDTTVNLLAYTFAFGNGFSATLSIEDPSTGGRRLGGYSLWDGANEKYVDYNTYGGVKYPDVIGALKVEQAWGKAQLAVALHDDYGFGYDTKGLGVNGVAKSKVGFAVLGGVEVKLGAADVVDLQAAYAKGAVAYVFANSYVTPLDFYYADGDVRQTTGWSVAGSWTHQWTKTVSTAAEVSYAKIDYDSKVGFSDWTQLDLIANVGWKPVSGLTFIVEGEYRKVDYSAAGLRDPSGFQGVLRVQRDF